jgi:hypothetical protein
MTFRLFISAVVVAIASLPVAAGAHAQGQGKPPEQKPAPPAEKPAAVNVAGKWIVTIDFQGQQRTSNLDLKVEGIKVTGTINSELGEAQLAGEYAEGKLKFGFSMDANGTPIQVGFVGTVQKDGTLAGMLDFGQGEIPWTAVRPKN